MIYHDLCARPFFRQVYNGLNVIHQAEGPHPRRWPRADAWRWLQEWAQQEGLRPDGPEGVPQLHGDPLWMRRR